MLYILLKDERESDI